MNSLYQSDSFLTVTRLPKHKKALSRQRHCLLYGPCLKNDKAPKRRLLFCHSALTFLAGRQPACKNFLGLAKNFISLNISLIFKQGLESVLKPAECRIGADFFVRQGDLTRESWRISSQINAVLAEKDALRRRFDGFKTDSRSSTA